MANTSRQRRRAGPVRRRVQWFLKVERTLEEKELSAELKGAKDVVLHTQKQVEKYTWKAWSPPRLEQAEILRVEEEVGGVVLVAHSAKVSCAAGDGTGRTRRGGATTRGRPRDQFENPEREAASRDGTTDLPRR